MSMTRALSVFALCTSTVLGQATWNVAAGAGPGGTGSAAQPFASIQAGIDAASTGDLVSVGPGTYVELIDFHGKAIEVRGEQGASATILDAHDTGPGVRCTSGEGPASVLRGVTVRNGYASVPNFPGAFGGSGMLIVGSSPSLVDCVFQNNRRYQGGAVAVVQGAPQILGCVFLQNAGTGGGAICFSSATGSVVSWCTFQGNSGHFEGNGGAVLADSPVRFEDCSFISNGAEVAGGAFHGRLGTFVRCSFRRNGALVSGAVSAEGPCTFTDCDFSENFSTTIYQVNAGAVRLLESGGFERCRFLGNSTAAGGGAVTSLAGTPVRLVDCLLSGNQVLNASIQPGGTAVQGRLQLVSCTIAGNGSGNAMGWAAPGSQITASDTIVWNNGATVSPAITLTADHCLIQGGAPGPGNIDLDPLFVDGSNGDLHLSAASPCRNAGTAIVPGGLPLTDLEGNPRAWESAPDIGAYEWVAPLPGTSDDLALFTSVDGGGLAAKVHPAPIGTSAAIGVFSPNGSLFGAPGILGIAVHPNGTMPGAVAPLPNLWIDPASAVLIPLPPIGEPGWTFEAVVPPALSGSTVRVQGAAFTPAAANGAYALTAAHEFMVP